MIPQIATPTGDIALTYAVSPVDGLLQVDLALTPEGDLQIVVGMDRLLQDLTRFFYLAPGADPYTPDYGNTLIGSVGQPQPAASALYELDLLDSIDRFRAHQATDAAAGYLAVDEQLASVDLTSMVVQHGALTIALTISNRAGAVAPLSVALPAAP